MKYNEKMFNRQIGRNTQLFAQAVSEIETEEARYPYLRILISVIEQARPEWIQVPQKEQLFTHLIGEMTEKPIGADEIARVIKVRDAERQLLHDIASGKVQVPAEAVEAAARQAAADQAAAEKVVADAPGDSAAPAAVAGESEPS